MNEQSTMEELSDDEIVAAIREAHGGKKVGCGPRDCGATGYFVDVEGDFLWDDRSEPRSRRAALVKALEMARKGK